MTYYEAQQQNPLQGAQQWSGISPQYVQGYGQFAGGQGIQGLGQAAYGQYGQYGGQQFGQPNMGAWGQTMGTGTGWGQTQRQLSQQEVGDVVRQLVPLLPHILAQAQQQQPQAAFGAFGGGYGQQQRMLTQQDINEVVRQILPIVPQIVGMLQGQGGQQPWAAMYGGQGSLGSFNQNPFAQTLLQQTPFGQTGLTPVHAAFGSQMGGQRQLTQQDVGEVVRHLVGIIPQVIGNLQSFTQQRSF